MCVVQDEIKDYYDIAYIHEKRYDRKREKLGKIKELDVLKKMGIKTIEIGRVSNMFSSSGKVIVYTDIYKHNGIGKKIVDIHVAKMMYPNYMCTEYFEGITRIQKMVQVGERKFMCNIDVNGLKEEKWVSIEERKKGYNYKVGLPIYSIDYLEVGSEFIACDFNEIQKLDGTGIDLLMTKDEVADEIHKALDKYKK